uniref:Sec16_C domain-containing protein n=1 Tax=Steinernema glaseri TaxID=37863 RepID=A0A1I8AAE5_9BILA
MSNQYWLHQPTSNAQQSAQQQQDATSYWNQINIGGPGAQSLSQPQTARAAQPSSLWVQEAITPVPTVDAQHQHIAQPQAQQHLVQPQQHHQPIIPPQVKQHQSVVSAAPLVTDGSSSTISSRGKVSHAAVAHVAPLASAPIQVDQPQNSENTLAPPQEEAAPLTPEPSSPPHHITTSTPIGNPVEMHIPTSDESGQTISSNPRQEEERDSHSSMVIVDRNDVADADTANRETIQAQQPQMVQNQQVPPGQSSAIESQDEDRSIAGSTRGGTKGAKSASANIRERYKNVCKE